MTTAEMISILEEIARDPKAYPSARVTALRALREIRADEREEKPSAFDELDDELTRRRRRAAAQRERRP
jgi:hypothetical protein